MSSHNTQQAAPDEAATAAPPQTEIERLRARLAQQEAALRRAEAQRDEYRERFDRLLELVPDAVIITDADDRIRYVNPEGVRLAGAADAAELLGRSVFDFVYPDDVPPARVAGERLLQARRPESGRLRIVQLGGRAVEVKAAAAAIRFEGETAVLSTAHDLTGRQHMRRTLSETQDLFYQIFQIVPAALLISRIRDGALLDVNEAFLLLTGYERDAVIGTPFADLEVLPAPDLDALVEQVRQEGAVHEIEVELRRKSGEVRTALASVGRILVRGEPCLLAVFLDVTERRQAAAAEQESRDLFRKIFQASPAAITISSMRDGTIIEANDAALRMSGFTREEMVGKQLARAWVHPEQRAALIRRLKAGETVENMEVEVYGRDGAVKVFNGSFQPLLVQDEPCLLSVVLDTTEQKRVAEALRDRDATLRSFYDTVSLMMGVVEIHDDDILHISDSVASAAFFGTTPEAMRRRFASVLGAAPQYIRIWIDAYRESKRIGQPVRLEYVHATKDGDRWLSATVAYVQTLPTGEERYSYVIADITERKAAEQALIEAKERAEATARLRAAILNNITHEVRTPLTVIVGFTSMLRKGVRKEYQRFVDRIERSGNRLMLMLDTILDLAQLEAGTFDLKPRPVDVVELVNQAVETLRPQAEEKGLYLEVEAAAPLEARLDQRVLLRVLHNLLDNAIKFTDEGGVHVSAEADAGRLYLKIRDTGVGIDEIYLAHVFDEFSQESTGLERTHQGSGLGLAVSRRLIELAGGAISVESHKGEGSLFTVEVPRFVGALPAA